MHEGSKSVSGAVNGGLQDSENTEGKAGVGHGESVASEGEQAPRDEKGPQGIPKPLSTGGLEEGAGEGDVVLGGSDMDVPIHETEPHETEPAVSTNEEAELDAVVGGGTEDDIGEESMRESAAPAGEEGASSREDLLGPLVEEEQESHLLEEHGITPETAEKPSEALSETIEVPRAEELAEPSPEAAPEPSAEEEVPIEVPRKRWRFRLPVLSRGAGVVWLRRHAKVAISLAAGIAAALTTGYILYSYQGRAPTGAALERDNLAAAIRQAEESLSAGRFQSAIEALEPAISEASKDHPRLPDAEFLRVEAFYRALGDAPAAGELERFHAAADRAVRRYPFHARAADALQWKAKAYERAGMAEEARDVYERLLSDFPDLPRFDEVLLGAARIALKSGQTEQAAHYGQRLLHYFPSSPLLGEARLLLGESYLAQQRYDAAREVLYQLATSQPDSRLGARAFAGLARLALEEGKVEETIAQLETRLEAALTIEGHDELYLVLAEAYRRKGQFAEAEQVLRDLIAFFPDTEGMPQAYIRLTEVLEIEGKRQDATRLAGQAAQRYPGNPEVLRNLAKFRLLLGDFSGAGDALLAAEDAGARDPTVLVDAAQCYKKADRLGDALRTYERLGMYYPGAPQAFEGRIEQARILYGQGQAYTAVRQLEELATQMRGKPQSLPTLVALGELYQDLGWAGLTSEVFERVASITTEPELLAQATIALFRAGALETGLTVANRVDVSRLSVKTAYAFLNGQGQALLPVDPRRGLETLEKAHELYPDQRTPQYVHRLLEAYLASDRTARARLLVSELESQVRETPEWAPEWERAAVAWADYLYGKRDFHAAAEAYAMAERASNLSGKGAEWAAFQRASALLHLEDFGGAIPILDGIAASGSPWAAPARLKATYARLEQRLRGLTAAGAEAGE